MDQVVVKKEFYECNAMSTTWSSGVRRDPVQESVISNNDPTGVLPQPQSELYCDITIKSEEIQLPDCTINPEEIQLPDCSINPEEMQLPDSYINPEEMQLPDCTISQGEIQMYNCPIKQEENQLYYNKVKQENIFAPYEKAAEQTYMQPCKITIKSEKFEVIEISDDSDDPDCTMPLESQEQIGIVNVKSLKPPEPYVEDDFPFSPEKMKIIPGKLAVCGDCGFFSMDFNCCFRCRRKLPLDCTVVDAQDAVTQVLDKSKMENDVPVPQLSVKEITPAASQKPLTTTPPVRKKRPKSKKSSAQHKPTVDRPRRVPGKMAVCPFCGFYSINFIRCNQSRCRRFLPENCLVIDAPEPQPRKRLSHETKENVSLESKPPVPVPAPDSQLSSNQTYQCNDCPFVSDCRKSYLYHKQFHRSRGSATVFKCPMCTYNVSQNGLLKEHIKLHREGGHPATETAHGDGTESAKESLPVIKETKPASAVQRPKPSTMRLKRGRRKVTKQPAANLKLIPGTFTMCSHCNRLSSNSIRCSRKRCRRVLPVDRIILDQNGKRISRAPGAPVTSRVFRCSECPFMNMNKTKYLHHKKLHLPGDTANLKCTMCSYNVPKRHTLIMHYKIHRSDYNPLSSKADYNPLSSKADYNPLSSKATGEEDSGSVTQQPRSERSARKSIVSYAEADSSDDELDRALMYVKKNELSMVDNSNRWESVSANDEPQEDCENQIDSDEYLFCYECEQSWKGDCPKHGSLLAVEDSVVPIDVENDVFAIRTAPSRVRIGNSGTPDKAKGIFAREALPSRLRFGPLKGKLGPPDGINSYTWLIRKDGAASLCVDLSEPGTSCWWRYVRVAKNIAEMNCAAYQYQGRLYVRTIRKISSQEELIVGPYDHNGLLIKYDPQLINKPKVSSWVSRSLKSKSEERRDENPKQRPTDCKIRSKPFSSKSSSQSSVRSATKEKPLCDKTGLNEHLREHEGEKHFRCSECGLRFYEKPALAMHLKHCHSSSAPANSTNSSLASISDKAPTTNVSVHAGKQSFVCNVCNQAFRYSFALKKHSCASVEVKPFKCSVCTGRFATKCSLKVHSRIHTGEKPFVCRICNEAFTYSSSLKKHCEFHSRVNEEENPFKCTECSVRFPQKSHLNLHMRMHCKEKPYVCNVCDARFSHQSYLKRHSVIHAGKKNHACTECNERFSKKDDLIAHSRVHSFVCDVCTQSFTLQADLEAHSRIHADEKPFKCTLCTRQFARRAHLNNHHRAHVDVGVSHYVCRVCEQGFSRMTALRIHSRTHKKVNSAAVTEGGGRVLQNIAMTQLGENQYACNVCKEIFGSEDAVKLHSRFHSKERRHECKVCKKRFSQTYHLTRHFATHLEKKVFECKFCKRQFHREDKFALHTLRCKSKEKPFACTACNEQFTKKIDLMDHVKLQHKSEQLYVCNVCNRSFSRLTALQIHNRIHTTREKLFACSKCPKRFYRKHHLSAHLLSHSNVKAFECNECCETFRTHYDLRNHKLIHAREITCIECKEQFPNMNDFITHPCSEKGATSLESSENSKAHSTQVQNSKEEQSIKPFACSKCPKRFYVKSKLEGHQSAHLNGKPFTCAHCPLKFSIMSVMEEHIAMRHAEQKNTEPGDSALSHNEHFNNERPSTAENPHLRPLGDQTPMTYTIRVNLPKKPTLCSDRKPFECPVCPWTFATENHFMRHVVTHAKRD